MSQTTKGEIQNMLRLLAEKILEKAHQEAEENHIPTRQAIIDLGFSQNAPYRWLKGEILRADRDRILTLCLFKGFLTEAEKRDLQIKLDLFWVDEWGKRYELSRKKPPEKPISIPAIPPTSTVTFEEVIKIAESFRDSLKACDKRKKEFLELFDAWRSNVARGFGEMVRFRNTMEGILNEKER